MAPKQRLLIRILQAIIHKIWAALFFLSTLSLISLANHYWSDILAGYHLAEGYCLKVLELIRN